MNTNGVVAIDPDFCPKCNTEGDPIQAIRCIPVKWSCPKCGSKWTADGILEDVVENPFQLNGY